MKEVDFNKSAEELEQATVDMKKQKEQYASLIGGSSETEINSAIQTERYEVEYLWVKLGNHATKNGITLKMDITKGTASQNKIYNLQFTATGKYANITDFIYEIENDSTLGFKIEGFKLLPSTYTSKDTSNKEENANNNATTYYNVESLVATFTVKDVYIDLDQISNSIQNTQDTDNNNTNTINENIITEKTNTVEENNNQVTNSIQ